MKNNITTLVLNLLISESKLHRIRIADTIADYLETNVGDFGGIEKRLRTHFLFHIQNCIENPSGKSTDFVYQTAAFYRESYIESVPDLMVAA